MGAHAAIGQTDDAERDRDREQVESGRDREEEEKEKEIIRYFSEIKIKF